SRERPRARGSGARAAPSDARSAAPWSTRCPRRSCARTRLLGLGIWRFRRWRRRSLERGVDLLLRGGERVEGGRVRRAVEGRLNVALGVLEIGLADRLHELTLELAAMRRACAVHWPS